MALSAGAPGVSSEQTVVDRPRERAAGEALRALDPDFLPQLRTSLSRHICAHVPALHEFIEPLLDSNAKYLRPVVVRLASAFGHPERGALLDLSVVIELVHTASLFHDDMIDRSPTRRGKTALHCTHGRLTAVLAGALLLHLSSHIVRGIRLASPAVESRLHEIFASAAVDICRGQWKESLNTGNIETDEALYMEIIELKTARLFEISFQAGALVSGGPEEALREFGHHFGLLYQIADDLRDLFAPLEEQKRPPGGDLRAGTYTLPVIRGLRKENSPLARLLRNRTSEMSPESIADYVAGFLRGDAAGYSLALASSCGARAKAAIGGLPRIPEHAILLDMVDDTVDSLTSLLERARAVA